MAVIEIHNKQLGTLYAIIDDEDLVKCSMYKWYIRPKELIIYGYFGKNRKVSLSRYIMEVTDTNIKVDHINHNRLDNRKQNLRLCSNQENCFNTRKHQTINGNLTTSKYKNVSWCKRKNKWRSYIVKNNKSKHIGYFDDEIEAAEHSDYYAIQMFGEFACLNFPDKNYSNFVDKIARLKKTSKFQGVSRNKYHGWNIGLKINKKQLVLTGFDNELNAASTYDFWNYKFNNRTDSNFQNIT